MPASRAIAHRELVVAVRREQHAAELEQPRADARRRPAAYTGGGHPVHAQPLDRRSPWSARGAVVTGLRLSAWPTSHIHHGTQRRGRGDPRGRASGVLSELPDAEGCIGSRMSCAPGSAAQPHRQGRLDLRLRANAARPSRYQEAREIARPLGQAGYRSSPAAARASWRRPTGGARGRRHVGRARDRPAARAGRQPLRRRRARLPLLLRSQGDVRPLRERLRRLPRRLRDARRDVRGATLRQTEKIRYFPIVLAGSDSGAG